MRTISLILAFAACGTIFAATRPETATYVDGDLPGISPNTGGTLSFDDDKAMYLRAGSGSVAVSYAAISSAQLGAVKETSHRQPLYKKVMVFHHGSNKTETQYLIVRFKTTEGEDHTMTLELAKSEAAGVLAELDKRSGKTAHAPAPKPAWWGDDYWKTSRNADKWNKSSSPEQR